MKITRSLWGNVVITVLMLMNTQNLRDFQITTFVKFVMFLILRLNHGTETEIVQYNQEIEKLLL